MNVRFLRPLAKRFRPSASVTGCHIVAIGSAPADLHPCVIVQSDLFNHTRIATTVICVITLNLERAHAPGNVPLKRGAGGLPKASVVNVSQVMTVNEVDLHDRIGKLPGPTFEAIRAGLGLLLNGLP